MMGVDWKPVRLKRPQLHTKVVATRFLPDGSAEKEAYLSAEAAAEAFGVTVHTVYRLMRSGGCTRTGVAFERGRRTRKR